MTRFDYLKTLPAFFFLSASCALALTPEQFQKQNPFEKDYFSLAPKAFQFLRVRENGQYEMVLSGQRKKAKEVFLDGAKISKDKNRAITGVVKLKASEEIHEIRAVQEDATELSFFFQVSRKRDWPKPLRLRVRSEKGETIEHSDEIPKEVSAQEWVDFEWLSENEVLTPEELELRETERKRRKLQLTLEEETEELQRLEEEKRRIAGLRNPDFRIGQGGSGRKPSAASVFRENLQSTVQVSQGLGFLNLQQSNQSTVDTAQWMAQVQNRVVSPEGWEAGLYGKAFLIPLSSGPTGLSPRFIKAGFDVGSRFDLGTWVKVKPRVGFDYQSLLSSSDVGYRNLMGPRLELAGEFDLAKGEVIKSEVFFNLFDLNLSSSGPKNYQWGARLIYEFEASFLSFTQVVIGAEMARLNMALYTAQLTSTQMATFVGIQF